MAGGGVVSVFGNGESDKNKKGAYKRQKILIGQRREIKLWNGKPGNKGAYQCQNKRTMLRGCFWRFARFATGNKQVAYQRQCNGASGDDIIGKFAGKNKGVYQRRCNAAMMRGLCWGAVCQLFNRKPGKNQGPYQRQDRQQ